MKPTSAEIAEIEAEVRKRLGDDAEPELVTKIVNRIVNKLYAPEIGKSDFTTPAIDDMKLPGTRVIVSAMGINHPGIVAGISTEIAECNGDIQDISQKILQEFFVMIMIVNIDNLKVSFNEFRDKLLKLGDQLGIKIFVQHEEIFRAVNRV